MSDLIPTIRWILGMPPEETGYDDGDYKATDDFLGDVEDATEQWQAEQ